MTTTFNQSGEPRAPHNQGRYKMEFLVKWLEGYGDAKPEVVALDEIKESDAWDLTDDVIDNLSSLEVGHEYFHYELGSTLNFIKL